MISCPALRARPTLVPVAITIGVGVILYLRILPHIFVSIRHGGAIYPVHPTQYVPIVLALVYAVSLASRFELWDRLGTRRVSIFSSLCAAATVLIPPLLVWIFPMSSDFPVGYTLGISSNVFVVASLCYLEVSLLGRLWGTVAAGATIWGLYILMAEVPLFARWGPLTMAVDYAAPDASTMLLISVRWPWIILLIVFVAIQAWRRRGLAIAAFAAR